MARAQACTYPTAGVLSGYSGQFNGTLSITNNRIGVNMLCGGQAFLTLNALTALVRIDLPAVGSPVMIETCGSVVDTIIAAGAYLLQQLSAGSGVCWWSRRDVRARGRSSLRRVPAADSRSQQSALLAALALIRPTPARRHRLSRHQQP